MYMYSIISANPARNDDPTYWLNVDPQSAKLINMIMSIFQSYLWTCLHYMFILRSQNLNKITDFFMILA